MNTSSRSFKSILTAAAGALLLAAVLPVQAKDVMLMNRIGPSRLTLHVANADGSGERALPPPLVDT